MISVISNGPKRGLMAPICHECPKVRRGRSNVLRLGQNVGCFKYVEE